MSAYMQILIPMKNVKFVGNPVMDYLITHGFTDTGGDVWYSGVARRCKEMFGLPKYTSDNNAVEYGFNRAYDQMYINENTHKFIPLHEAIEGTNIFRYQYIDLNYLKYCYSYEEEKEDPITLNRKMQLQKLWDHPYVIKHQYSDGTEFRSIVGIQPDYDGKVCYVQATNEFRSYFMEYQMFYIGTDLKDVQTSLQRILNTDYEEAVNMYDYFVSAFSFYTEQGANPILKIRY